MCSVFGWVTQREEIGSECAGVVEEIDRGGGGAMLAWDGSSVEETDTAGTMDMLERASEVLRSPGVEVLAVRSSEVHDFFGLRQIVASLDHASVSLRGRC